MELLGQVGLGCRPADAFPSIICLVGLDCYARGEGSSGIGRPGHGGRGC